MGRIRLIVPRPEKLPNDALQCALMAGVEGIPWQCAVQRTKEGATVTRAEGDSGNLYLPWSVAGFGRPVLSTASLMERETPYHLPVELARGTINRVRNQLAAWRQAGLTVSAEIETGLLKATSLLAAAATGRTDPLAAEDLAEQAIAAAMTVIAQLGAEYATEVLAMRHRQTPKLNTLFAVTLRTAPQDEAGAARVRAGFNAVQLPLSWRQIELNAGEFHWQEMDARVQWCRGQGLRVCGGPLLQLDAAHVPDWLYLWEDDFDNVQSYVNAYLEATVRHYAGRMHLWHCAARMNSDDCLSLTEEQKLRLMVDALSTVRQLDSRTPLLVSFDRPWAEYLGRAARDLSPLHFADALVRADLGLAGLGLEINLGYSPGGTLPRDLLEFSRMIDRWSLLGLPLLVMLTAPSSTSADPAARHRAQPLCGGITSEITPSAQRQLVDRLLPMLLSKQAVQGVVWNQWEDAFPHDFPHGGLIDLKGRPKPALAALAALRKQHLM